MGWDGMGQDGMGWDVVGWDGMRRPAPPAMWRPRRRRPGGEAGAAWREAVRAARVTEFAADEMNIPHETATALIDTMTPR